MILFRLTRILLRATAVVAAGLLVLLGLAWLAGRALIARAEPETLVGLPEGISGRIVMAGGRGVHVVERGGGPVMLLVHGFGGSTFDWEEHLVEPLSASYRVVAVDLLGAGFSARDDRLPYGLELWAEQLRELLDTLGVARATVAGHSLGGAVATIFGAREPRRVEALVLVAPFVPFRTASTLDRFTALETPGLGELLLGLYDGRPLRPGASPAARARGEAIFRMRGTRYAMLRALRGGIDAAALDAALRALTVPTLFILGTADERVPYVAQRHAVTVVENAHVLPIEGAGHWLLHEHPARIVAAIAAWSSGRVTARAEAATAGLPLSE